MVIISVVSPKNREYSTNPLHTYLPEWATLNNILPCIVRANHNAGSSSDGSTLACQHPFYESTSSATNLAGKNF